jgi:hypothetical protein
MSLIAKPAVFKVFKMTQKDKEIPIMQKKKKYIF